MTDEQPERTLGLTRLGIGLLQGVALWLLYDAAKANTLIPEVRGALQLLTLFAPLILIGGLGAIRTRTLLIWAGTAGLMLAGLGAWDVARGLEPLYRREMRWPSVELIMAAGASVFIAHHLVEVGDRARKWIGPFADYFDTGWKHGVQLALSAGFVGALWLLLGLGSSLFDMIGIDALSDVITKPWFAWPATAVALAGAVHLTDIRANLVRGVRMVALALLSWLLPLLTAIIAPFLAALLVVGLDKLLGDVSAAGLLLAATGGLIILINAAYQDGETPPLPLLRWTARLACILLVPLVLLAGYAVGQRIGQYGLTPERVVACAFVIVGACHAIGYFWAAVVLKGPWLKRLEITNILSAIVALAVLLALFSPVGDPARLSVSNQMSRLKSGAIDAEKFDYDFLRFESGRFGRDALDELANAGAGPKRDVVVRRAKAAKARQNKWNDSVVETTPRRTAAEVEVFPEGRSLPEDFFPAEGSAGADVRSLCLYGESCTAYFIDLDGDKQEEILLRPNYFMPTVYGKGEDGRWTVRGKVHRRCIDAWSTKEEPRAIAPEARFHDIAVGDLRYHVVPAEACDPPAPVSGSQ